ncbi:copper resistance CopC family protein [Arthrobacter sp. C9C5]|uniref:copper resistance CopC family protein n=1 Tax=Arthrobacter sp. C9C5 TaxID=2735267 RepID=UPI001584BD8C|nr:copper resistance CopC family protein [Arthrobacter sp. C9C5]NUU31781.1 copper resistance protein CopC [Arthrobacter sp. C9C5]
MRLTRQLPGALLGLITLVAFLLGAALLGAGPASAHDAVESTSPAAGATVPAPPAKVSLTLSNHPLALGTQIKVSAAGSNWADGAVEIVDNVASQKLKAGAPAGLYTVQWRVASSDGHPIEGTFTFTAAGGASATGAAPASGTVPTLGTAQPGTTIAPSPAPDASQPFPWSIVVFVAVAVGILVALGLMAKRRLNGGDDGYSDSETAGDATANPDEPAGEPRA